MSRPPSGDRAQWLPLAGEPPPERRDAARSRRRLLDAAHALLADRGPESLTMNAVAATAGVGVGTAYRRFGDLGGLLHAVLDDQERSLQHRLLAGETPFDPDDDPAAQITAFLHAYVDYLERNLALLYHADTATPGARFAHGAYAFYRHHLAGLLADADPALDPRYTADLLLAATDAELYATQRREHGLEVDTIKRALAAVVAALAASSGPDAG